MAGTKAWCCGWDSRVGGDAFVVMPAVPAITGLQRR